MKVRLSLPSSDIEFLDEYAAAQGIGSRSAVVHEAVRLLRAVDLSKEYEAAWRDGQRSQDETAWDATVSDGLST